MRIRLGIGMGRLSSKRSNLAVRGGAPGRKVGDNAVGRAHLFDRHTPGLGRRQQQPLARFRAGELKIIAAVPHRRGGIGPHAPVKAVRDTGNAGPVPPAELGLAAAQRIGGALAHDVERPFRRHFPAVAIGGRILRPDLAPVALQLLAHHHGIGGPHPLAELGLGDANRHGIVGRDDDPGVDLVVRGFAGQVAPAGLAPAGLAPAGFMFWAAARCGIQNPTTSAPVASAAVDRSSRRDRPGLLRSLLIITEPSLPPTCRRQPVGSPCGCGGKCCNGTHW